MHNLNVIIKYTLALLILFATYTTTFAEKLLRINEFCTSNKSILTAANGNTEDWIELRNLTDQDINLAGWSLTDSPQQLTKFQFPKTGNIPIKANGFFLIYASGSDIPLVKGEWHANFSLSKSGEYLALVNPDGEIEDEISPNYPEQYTDISYGVIGNYSADTLPVYGYFESPTPRRPNGISTTLYGRVASVNFNQEHGFRSSPFSVALSCEDADAQIFYTLDGCTPSAKSSQYSSPLRVTSTTTLRTIAIKDGYLPSSIRSHSWIFIDDVLKQNTMRRAIVNNSNYKNRLKEGQADDAGEAPSFREWDTDIRLSITTETQLMEEAGMDLAAWDEAVAQRKQEGLSHSIRAGLIQAADPDAQVLKEDGRIFQIGASSLFGPVTDALDAYCLAYRLAGTMGGSSKTVMILKSRLTMNDTTVYSFQQIFDGEEVLGGTLKIAVDADNAVTAVFSCLDAEASGDQTVITREEAEAIVASHCEENGLSA